MPIVLTCGQVGSSYSLAQSALTLAGVSPPNLFRNHTFTAEELTSRICEAYNVGKNGAYSQIAPGQVWQALSVDMALANLDQESWGWADPNSIYLLNYWRDFDPRLNFVLVYSSPEYHLARILQNGEAGPRTIEGALRDWRAYNEELLRFYSSNSDRTVLVNAESVLQNPVQFLSACEERLKLNLKRINTPVVADDEKVSAFALLSASTLLSEVPEAQSLFEELESAADLPRTLRQNREAMMSRAWAEHRELSARFAELSARVAELTAERDEGRRANDNLLQRLKETREELQRTLERLRELEEEAGRNADALRQLIEQNRDLQRTIEAMRADKQSLDAAAVGLRSALYEASKELEQALIDARKKEGEILALQGKRVADMGALRQQTEQNRELQQTVKALRADKERLEAEAAGASRIAVEKVQKENELLLAQLHQAREKLELAYAVARKKEGELRALQGKQAGNQELQQTVVALRADKARLEAEAAGASSTLDEAKRESESLLFQLHQVQEELEHYFLKFQALEKGKEQPPAYAAAAAPEFAVRAETVLHMRDLIEGENWHKAEHDGRWAGPGTVSVLQLPKVPSGRYRVELDVVDAVVPEIVKKMTVSVDGKQVQMKRAANKAIAGLLGRLKRFGKRELYPLLLTGEIEVEGSADRPRLTLTFPRTVSPKAIRDSTDSRELAIRVRQVKLSPC